MKKIYAALWVDDFGSSNFSRNNINWYHLNAGPISFAMEIDARFFWSFDDLGQSKQDLIAHHHHSVKPLRKQNILEKNIYQRLFRLKAIDLYALFQKSHPWEFRPDDDAFNKRELIKIRKLFLSRGINYPPIVRHGWNYPPVGLNQFYMTKLGVLADSSCIPDKDKGIENKINIGSRYGPYYSSIRKGFAFESRNEADKGLLEIPVVLDNFTEAGFNKGCKDRIEKVPENGLVSTYIHPWDKFDEIKKWIKYLKGHYDVSFVRADEFMDMAMSANPRPIVIKENKAYWAFSSKPINLCHAVIVKKGCFEVKTSSSIPEIEIKGKKIRNVKPGIHRIRC